MSGGRWFWNLLVYNGVYRGSLGALSSVALAKDDAPEWEGIRESGVDNARFRCGC